MINHFNSMESNMTKQFISVEFNNVCLDAEVEFDYDDNAGVSPTKLMVDITGTNNRIIDCTRLLDNDAIMQSVITSIMDLAND